MNKIIITGGHHSSALPVIEIIRKRYPNIKIYWLGHKYSMRGDKNPTLEYQEIRSLNIPFYNLIAGKFYKTFDPIRLVKIPLGFFHAFYLLIKIKPEIVLSFGGYLAVPVVITAKFLKVPVITHEQTVVVGYANYLISKFADHILCTWPSSMKYFGNKRVSLVGLPLREEIFNKNGDSITINTAKKTIYITGGKTGSHLLNETIYEILPRLLSKYNIIHQCGDHSGFKDYDKLSTRYQSINKDSKSGIYHLEKFIFSDHIGEVFNKADLVITRSGAHICYEIASLSKPCILIPIPWVSHNEQYENAKMLKKLGLAEIYFEKDLKGVQSFENLIDLMMQNLNKYQCTEKDILVKNSANRIVDAIEEVYKKEYPKK